MTRCIRCDGRGGWEGWPGFTCYRCGGDGREPILDDEARAAKRTRAAERKAERTALQAQMDADIYTRRCSGCGVWTNLGPTHPCRLCGTPYAPTGESVAAG